MLGFINKLLKYMKKFLYTKMSNKHNSSKSRCRWFLHEGTSFFFEDFPPFGHFCMNFIVWGSGYSYCRTKSKTLCCICFRWSFMEKSSAQAIYLLFEELCLPHIFVYKNCVKSIKRIFFMYFMSLFIKPNRFYINIYK